MSSNKTHSERMAEVWTRPGYREAMSAKFKAVWLDPEYRARQTAIASARGLKAWHDPVCRAKTLAAIAAGRQNSGANAKISQQATERWANDDFKARVSQSMSAGAKNRWANEPRVKCEVCGKEMYLVKLSRHVRLHHPEEA